MSSRPASATEVSVLKTKTNTKGKEATPSPALDSQHCKEAFIRPRPHISRALPPGCCGHWLLNPSPFQQILLHGEDCSVCTSCRMSVFRGTAQILGPVSHDRGLCGKHSMAASPCPDKGLVGQQDGSVGKSACHQA